MSFWSVRVPPPPTLTLPSLTFWPEKFAVTLAALALSAQLWTSTRNSTWVEAGAAGLKIGRTRTAP